MRGFFQNLRIKFSPIIRVNLDVRKHLNLTWPNFLGKFCSKYREQDMPVKNKNWSKNNILEKTARCFLVNLSCYFRLKSGKILGEMCQQSCSVVAFKLLLSSLAKNKIELCIVTFCTILKKFWKIARMLHAGDWFRWFRAKFYSFVMAGDSIK